MKSKLEEYMEIVSWLNRYRRALFHIERLEEELIRWDAKAQKMTPSSSSIVSASSNGAPAAVVAVEMAEDVTKRLEKVKTERDEKREEIEQAIMALPAENQQKVMYSIYIDLLKQKDVASKLHYHPKHIYRIHILALDELKKMLPNVTFESGIMVLSKSEGDA